MKASIFYIILFSSITIIGCSNDDDTSTTTPEPEVVIDPVVEKTSIPDPVFEAYLISRNLDDTIDGEVVTSNLLNVTEIIVDDLEISDLTGIQDCPNLYNLWLQNCNVASIDVSQNPLLQFFYADNNTLSSLDVSDLPLLEKLSLRNNTMQTIDVTANSDLQLLEINGNNLQSINVSQNPQLLRFDIRDNPLTCVQASEDQIANDNLIWFLDDEDMIAVNCN